MSILRSLTVAVSTLISATSVWACPVCVDLPERTMADHILDDWVTVLAVPSEANPFSFEVVQHLRGDPDDLEGLPQIPFLVSSALRRTLQQQPDAGVLLTFGPERDRDGRKSGGDSWHKFILVTQDRRQVIDGILDEGDRWSWGETRDPARIAYFGGLLSHPDKTVQNLALAEISRAPYSAIRTLAGSVPATELMRRLTTLSELPYASVAALLLGVSDDPQVPSYVRRRFAHSLEHGGLLLGSWAVAGVELDREKAVQRIAARLARQDLLAGDRQNLHLALSVAGTALPELRPVISEVLKQEARRRPEAVADIAYTLYDWEDWTLTEQFQVLLSGDEIDHATRYILQIMVDTAEETARLAGSD